LTVVGDSPVARALVGLAPRVGLRVAVVAQGAQSVDFPDADAVLANDEALEVSARLASPFVVVATQGRRDLQGLKAALALQPEGLWFVASARKAGVLRQTLVASGEDAAAVARIVAPAGEFIGAQTPEEIALSVLTAVVAARRGRATQASPVSVTAEASSLTAAVAATAVTEVAKATVGSCCGGSKKAAAQASSNTVALALAPEAPQASSAAAAPSSCCGG
jgi:xanthine dehydrogenase accessory factor